MKSGNKSDNMADSDTESISNAEFDKIVFTYDRRISPEESVPHQLNTTAGYVCAIFCNIIIDIFNALRELINLFIEDIKSELSSKKQSPEKGIGWDLFKQTLVLLLFGLLITSTDILLHQSSDGPHVLVMMIKWVHWGYYCLVITIQATRYVLYEFRKVVTEFEKTLDS